MKVLSVLLILIGIVGLLLSSLMFGDIGIAAAIGSITAILTGVGFSIINKKIKVVN